MIEQKLNELIEQITKHITDKSVCVELSRWRHMRHGQLHEDRLTIQLCLVAPGADSCTMVGFDSLEQLKAWAAEGCDEETLVTDQQGILRVPERVPA